MFKKLLLIFPLVISLGIYSQDAENNDSDVEEVVVVGSQIKGAKITGALPVSIISADDMDALGVDSGDELLDNIAELGQNTFNQNEFSGGYNASRAVSLIGSLVGVFTCKPRRKLIQGIQEAHCLTYAVKWSV